MRDLTARRVTLVVAAVLTTGISAGAEPAPAGTAKRAFAVADFYRLRPVLEPVISPDGRTIVYTVTSRDFEHAKQTVHLWRVDADGTHARALTGGDTTNQQPTFSPDGGRLAFLSTRSSESQVWILPLGGGEPEQKTWFPGGVGEFLFSPDGRRLVAATDVYPECGADAACNKKRDDARQSGALKAHLADTLLYRHSRATSRIGSASLSTTARPGGAASSPRASITG